MKAGLTHYAYTGVPEFRKAIADYYARFGYVVKDPVGQITIESGGSQAIYRALGAILNPGDEIIFNDPTYGGYSQPALYFGAKIVRAAMKKDRNGIFRPSIENLRNAVTPKTKAFLCCNPDNPTGVVYTEKEIKEIAELCVQKDIVCIVDEVYAEYLWGNNKHCAIINQPGMEDRTLVLMSFSKTFAWTGIRAGFVLGGPELMKYVNQVPIGIVGMPVPYQHTAIKALAEGWDFVGMMRNEYRKRVDCVVKRLNEIDGITCAYPEGAFYVFPDVSGVGVPDVEFAAACLEAKARGIAGSIYGPAADGHMRLALVVPCEKCVEACNRIEKVAGRLKK